MYWPLQVKAEKEIESLKKKCVILESKSLPFMTKIDEMNTESIDDLIFLMGGYDGVTWLSTLDSYSPMHDVIKPLKPMNFVRSYAAVAVLKDEFCIFGGRDGSSWHDTGISLHSSCSMYVCVYGWVGGCGT